MKASATFVDDLFFISILLLFLMINYNMPLSSIYSNMVIIAIIMYLTPILLNLFKWIPVSDKSNRIKEIGAGIAVAIGFIIFYKKMTATPMAAVFATTAFGESVYMHKFVFGGLIPVIEQIFFFVILPMWILWKMGKPFGGSLFSMDNMILMVGIAAIFTIFHATSKGLENTEWMTTFVFGVLMMGLTIFFQAALPGMIAHTITNSYAVELFKEITTNLTLTSPIIMVGGVIAFIYFLSSRRFKFGVAG